jgi:hypothetical protein
MKSKIYKLFYLFILLFLIYQMFLFFVSNGNTSIVILGGSADNNLENTTLLINNKVVDTLNMNLHYSYSEVANLSFGKNDIRIKNIKGNLDYNTTINFIGIFTFHSFVLIEDDEILHNKSLFSFRLE